MRIAICGLLKKVCSGGGGGRVERERRLERQQYTKLSQKYQHDGLYLQAINSDKHLPQSPFTGQFILINPSMAALEMGRHGVYVHCLSDYPFVGVANF
jgi:hypothetical protein